ncbi:adenylyltransferase/cytidyltransferase family protein [Salipaludibacillus sp. LMS25]|uniref:adenylyltransferase/cytidyltransferase family protein n=1 Tax=Salipaludibacillus sp. LMS25 TaxID=2924031 RepID=UPI0020D0645D|nr:adenylyltransferase/cytidyltransferase family protein [Salipaludibacillus sp. LMS25]
MKPIIIGYTTGVFDLFHIGHLNILKRAKEHCDYLIAGVSTDELVQSYKNKTPVIPFHERIAIVDSIQYVDKVIAQEHRDKYKTWEELQYDVMFVGDDWKGTPLFDDLEAKFQKVGVNIKYFPYTGGVSSTLVKEKLLT